jgi:hypothetical protein
MVNSDELITTTKHLTVQVRCCINRCRHNPVRLYMHHFVHGHVTVTCKDHLGMNSYLSDWKITCFHERFSSCCSLQLKELSLDRFGGVSIVQTEDNGCSFGFTQTVLLLTFD